MKQARKKKTAIGTGDDAILLLRPESSGSRFLVKIRAFDLTGITKFKKNMKGKASGRSNKVTRSCKCVAFVDKLASKKTL